MKKSEFKRFCSADFDDSVERFWKLSKLAKTPQKMAELEWSAWQDHGGKSGNRLLAAALEAIEDRRKNRQCKSCGRALEKRREEKTYRTLVGDVRVKRWYYSCGRCHQGFSPLDELVTGPKGNLSRGVQERISEAGSDWGFKDAAHKLLRYSRIRVSASTVQRHAERLGAEVATRQFQKPLNHGRWQEPGERDVAIDAGKMHTKERGWVDVKIAVFSKRDVDARHYSLYCGHYQGWGKTLRRSCAAVKLSDYKDLWVRGDGADWIWELARVNFPDAHQLVDFYHAAQHLCDFGKIVFGDGSLAAKVCNAGMCHDLKRLGPQAVLDVLARFPLRKKKEKQTRKALQQYIERRKERMDYPGYQGQKREIGSGMVESACKEILNRRIKRARNWRLHNGMAIANLRAIWKADEWNTFWQEHLQSA